MDKVIVTNFSALEEKYGRRGLARVRASLDALARADRRRGLETQVVALDRSHALGGDRVRDMASMDENKRAIDRAWHHWQPAYLMIVGSHDVVPHQVVHNPLFDGDDDPDDEALVPTDLPYACDAPHSLTIVDFIGPTRVVGRLPDLTGAEEPSHLIRLIDRAALWMSRPQAEYRRCFSVCVKGWRISTRRTLHQAFGTDQELATCPPADDRWGRHRLSARIHFINCHGDVTEPRYYSQRGDAYPTALRSRRLHRGIQDGTVVTAECCYGAELFDPRRVDGELPISQTYLLHGAYGFFGSTNSAYGGERTMNNADLLCRFFVRHVLRGASLGRAALEARHDFAKAAGAIDPTELKTIAQFHLLADPSIHPVEIGARRGSIPKNPPLATKGRGLPPGRRGRRKQMAASGRGISRRIPVARHVTGASLGKRLVRQIGVWAKRAGLRGEKILSYEVRSALPKGAWARGGPGERFHVICQKTTAGPARRDRKILIVHERRSGACLRTVAVRHLRG